VNPTGHASCPASHPLVRQVNKPLRKCSSGGRQLVLVSLLFVIIMVGCGGITRSGAQGGDARWTASSIAEDGAVYWSGVVGETVVQVSRKLQQDDGHSFSMLQVVGRDLTTGAIAWRQQLAMAEGVWTTCLVWDDTLILTGGARVAALNTTRGTFNWIRDMNAGSVQRVELRDGWLWVQSTDNDLLTLSHDGERGRRWTLPAGHFWVTYGMHNQELVAVTSDASWLTSANVLTLWDLSGKEPEPVWTRDLVPLTMAVLVGGTHVLTFQSDGYTTRHVRALPYDTNAPVDEDAFTIPGTCATLREGVICNETLTEGNLTFVTLRFYNGSSEGPAWTRSLIAPGGWCESHSTALSGPLTYRCQNLVYALDASTGDVAWVHDLTKPEPSLDLCGAVGETDSHMVMSCSGEAGNELVGLRTNDNVSLTRRMVIP
jgi:outer membrane protein assembly factor BamB